MVGERLRLSDIEEILVDERLDPDFRDVDQARAPVLDDVPNHLLAAYAALRKSGYAVTRRIANCALKQNIDEQDKRHLDDPDNEAWQ